MENKKKNKNTPPAHPEGAKQNRPSKWSSQNALSQDQRIPEEYEDSIADWDGGVMLTSSEIRDFADGEDS